MKQLFVFLILYLSFVQGCVTSRSQQTSADSLREELPLKNLARLRKIRIGTALSAEQIKTDPNYTNLVARELNSITPENEMKFKWTEPRKAEFNFDKADEIVEFAQKHDMTVRGHNLAWCHGLPKWLEEPHYTPKQLEEILHEHIKAVMGHFRDRYPGRVTAWDVVNEAFENDGSNKRCTWSRIGDSPHSYIELAFKWAREADPNAKLYYNEFGAEGFGPKFQAVYELVRSLKHKGIAIDGVGFQMHLGQLDKILSFDEFHQNIERLSKLNVDVAITEIDYALRDGPLTQNQLTDQADFFSSAIQTCLQSARCVSFTMWGFTDKYSWIPEFEPGQGRATPFDADLKPKPAYFKLKSALGESTTR